MIVVDEGTLELLRDLRVKLQAKQRHRNKDGKEVSAKVIRAVIDRGREAEARALRYLLNSNDDADAVGEDVLRAIADHLHNLPKAANAPSHFKISNGDAWLMDQLTGEDGRDRIGKLVRVGKKMKPPTLDPAITDEAHIDRIERNRGTYELLKSANMI
ncbi:hypothetical protein M2226_008917 [Bradyrhizobium elkanii]|uniref:hypothetical protein n=1 Tax=Bradyrhizobium elkanii TaxID=29448 RepID=UPI0022270001|nr:hypothetical protein [Bradyrhizobium elkanii]MCW2130173.1 hypothetical protein [Bradyrhizobium elkanii]MCW2167850.1 hypothetical protein [Bradyrhizobium elkanii]